MERKSGKKEIMKAFTIALISVMLFSVNLANASSQSDWVHHGVKLVKWSDPNINVFIQTQDLMQREYVITALNNWQWYTNNTIRFNVVDKFGEADVSIVVTSDLQTNLTCATFTVISAGCIYYDIGSTRWKDDYATIIRASVHIGTNVCVFYFDEDYVTHEECERLDDIKFFRTMVHEIGHIIGLKHIDNKYDIMYQEIPDNHQQISKYSIELISQVYSDKEE